MLSKSWLGGIIVIGFENMSLLALVSIGSDIVGGIFWLVSIIEIDVSLGTRLMITGLVAIVDVDGAGNTIGLDDAAADVLIFVADLSSMITSFDCAVWAPLTSLFFG